MQTSCCLPGCWKQVAVLSTLVLPQAWQASVPASRAIGQIQKEVSQVLGQLLVPQHVGQLTEDGLFLLDICVAGQRVALELDGPEHYLRNAHLVTGRSLHAAAGPRPHPLHALCCSDRSTLQWATGRGTLQLHGTAGKLPPT